MDINNYRSRITIEKLIYTSNNIGGYSKSWNTVDTVWCEFIPLSGEELVKYMQVYNTAKIKINIRYRKDLDMSNNNINELYRVKYRNKYYNIVLAIDIDNMREEIEILAEGEPSEQ